MHCEPRQRPHRQRRLDLGTSRDANDSPYVASKFALKGMTDVLRRELRPQDIDIVMIEPGGVKAPLMNKSSQEIQKILLDVPPGLVQRHGAMITTVLEKVKGHGVPEWTRVWWLRSSARRWPCDGRAIAIWWTGTRSTRPPGLSSFRIGLWIGYFSASPDPRNDWACVRRDR
jgi:NAD(P)-dependent dehydrogenase (short-subunit alcohol dehydrogenase family)